MKLQGLIPFAFLKSPQRNLQSRYGSNNDSFSAHLRAGWGPEVTARLGTRQRARVYVCAWMDGALAVAIKLFHAASIRFCRVFAYTTQHNTCTCTHIHAEWT